MSRFNHKTASCELHAVSVAIRLPHGANARAVQAHEESLRAATGRCARFVPALVTRHAWGNTWQRPGIDLRTRSIVTVSMLVALGRMHELKAHMRGALNNGVTKEELQEIFLHASVYWGFPAAVDAFRTAAEVIDAAPAAA
jgi:4-carboxymuconolactone decarboxylase